MPSPRRARPEFDTVVVPVRKELENAGFRVAFLGKTHWTGRAWISNVPNGLSDIYAWHPERKLSVWVETKAPGGKPTPGQRAFLEDHAGSETQAVCWDDVELCRQWLIHEGLLEMIGGVAHYPDGIHSIRWSQFPTEEQEWQS